MEGLRAINMLEIHSLIDIYWDKSVGNTVIGYSMRRLIGMKPCGFMVAPIQIHFRDQTAEVNHSMLPS